MSDQPTEPTDDDIEVVTADLDEDGQVDAITMSGSAEIDIDGDGIADGVEDVEVTMIDVDGDGVPDIVETEREILPVDDEDD